MAWRILILLLLCLDLPAQETAGPKHPARSLVSLSHPDSISRYFATLAYHYLNEQRYDSAKYYYRKTIRYKTNDRRFLAHNLNNLGVAHFQEGTLDSSIFYYNAAYREYELIGDSARMDILDINLGTLYKQKGLYEKSLTHLLQASRRLERLGNLEHLAASLNSIGNVHARLGQLRAALDFHYRALAVRQKLNDKRASSSSYNNIGNVYLTLNRYDSALTNFQKALELKRNIGDLGGEAICLNNIGELLIKKGELRQAEALLKRSLAIRMEKKEKVGQASSRRNLANLYIQSERFVEAKRQLDISEELATSLQLLDQLKGIFELRVELCEKTGNVPEALRYSQKLLVVKDSLLNKEKAESLAEMQARYESLKKEDRIALLEKEGLLQAVELDRKQAWIISLIIGIALILIIVVLIYHNLRTVRKNKVHIELLLKELHHRVKNNLQILSSLLSLQSQQLTDDTAIKAVKSSESRINAMALIHRKLYTIDQNRTVDIKEYITELIQYLVYSYGYHERNFKLDLEIKEISIDVDKAIPLGLILNELISNAFKHAYENHPNPRLVVNLAYPDTNELNICIQDNGAGMPPVDDKQRKTFGMKIVSTLIKELKGNLNVKSENGTTYNLQIPI